MPGSQRGNFRSERVAEMVHKELAQRLRTQVKDPRMEPISITDVSVNRDLSKAKVRFLPLGGGTPSDELLAGLESASKQLRGPIGRALKLRHAPEISFEYDAHHDQAMAVTAMLDKLTKERESAPDSEEES